LIAGIIARFANQTITHRRLVTEDSYEGNVYDPPIGQDADLIRARYEPDRGTIRTMGGEEVDARDYVLTETQVGLNDLLEDRQVKRYKPAIKKNGVLLGYEVWLG
jgi:hypothetical protein